MALQLFVNTAARTLANALVRSVSDNTPASLPELVVGDQRLYELYFVDGLGNFETWSGTVSYLPYLAIGGCRNPTNGTFPITFNTHATGQLAFNISPSALQTALEGLSGVGAGQVAVTGSAGVYYRIEFTGSLGNAAQPEITGDATLLAPESNVVVAVIQAGDSTHNNVQLIQLRQNPTTFASGWATITNGWTGTLSTATLEMIEALASDSPYQDTFQITVQDSTGARRTYVKQNAVVYCTVIDPDAYVGANKPQYVTQAQLAAATLANGIFTEEAQTISSAGNSNVTRPSGSHHHTAFLNFTGAAGTYTVSALTTNAPTSGDTILTNLLLPATAGLIINIYNASTGGTLLRTFTSDGTGTSYGVILGYNGATWQLVTPNGSSMQTSQNLAGLSDIVTARKNIGSLFANIAAKTASFTALTADDGKLFRMANGVTPAVVTLPSASAVDSGFAIAIYKADAGAGSVTTSPGTVPIVTLGEMIVVQSDGSTWTAIIHTGQAAAVVGTSPIVMPAITGIHGGGGTNLDGLTTADGRYPAGTVVLLTFAGVAWWQLQAGTAADDPTNGIARPADYNASTNTQIWVKIG